MQASSACRVARTDFSRKKSVWLVCLSNCSAVHGRHLLKTKCTTLCKLSDETLCCCKSEWLDKNVPGILSFADVMAQESYSLSTVALDLPICEYYAVTVTCLTLRNVHIVANNSFANWGTLQAQEYIEMPLELLND